MPVRLLKKPSVIQEKKNVIKQCCTNLCNVCVQSIMVLVPLFQTYDEILMDHIQEGLALGVRQHVHRLSSFQELSNLTLATLYTLSDSVDSLSLTKEILTKFTSVLQASEQVVDQLELCVCHKCIELEEEERMVLLRSVLKTPDLLSSVRGLFNCGVVTMQFLLKGDFKSVTQRGIVGVLHSQIEKIHRINTEVSKWMFKDLIVFELFHISSGFSLLTPEKLIDMDHAKINISKIYLSFLSQSSNSKEYIYEHYGVDEIEVLQIENLENALLLNKYKRIRKFYAILFKVFEVLSMRNSDLESFCQNAQFILCQADDFQLPYKVQLDLHREIHKNLLIIMRKIKTQQLFETKMKTSSLFNQRLNYFMIAAQKVSIFEKEGDKIGTYLALQEMEDSNKMADLLQVFKVKTRSG